MQFMLLVGWFLKKSSRLQILGQMNRNLVGSTYGRFCIKFSQSRMKGERHRLSGASSYSCACCFWATRILFELHMFCFSYISCLSCTCSVLVTHLLFELYVFCLSNMCSVWVAHVLFELHVPLLVFPLLEYVFCLSYMCSIWVSRVLFELHVFCFKLHVFCLSCACSVLFTCVLFELHVFCFSYMSSVLVTRLLF